MQLHEFMCPTPLKLNKINVKELINNHPSRLAMGMDFEEKKIHFKHGSYSFKENKSLAREIFGSYKPWPLQSFSKQMLDLINQPIQMISDFEDCRGTLQEAQTGLKYNCFTYNRLRGIGDEILWQRAGFFVPNETLGYCLDGRIIDNNNFKDKINKIYWRGGLNGSNWLSNVKRDSVLSLKTFDEFVKARYRYSRINAIFFGQLHPEIMDFKLTGTFAKDLIYTDHPNLWSENVSKNSMLDYKYILCPNGNDVSTQLYWVIGTNSLAFKEDCEYEIIPDFFLKPWIHYIPVSKGLNDLKEKFDYIERNPSLAMKIIENANSAYNRIVNSNEWEEAELIVLQKLGYLK
ncbi:MAG: glycosyl transferase family 90 [Legionella sp.]|uniref:glycosyl transferase family 90 n=1 Tax=Legionella sp. TaxID=459 RepID=UPI0039E3886C